MHRPKKCGPVIRPDRARGQRSLQSRSAPQWNPDKGIWEWWYFGEHVYYATSTDGETWERLSVGLYAWNGSRDNNIADDPEAGERQRLTHDTTLSHDSYVQTYLERDVRNLRQVGDLAGFQSFLKVLAARSGQLLNLTDVARDIGVAVNTIKAWLSVLEATY